MQRDLSSGSIDNATTVSSPSIGRVILGFAILYIVWGSTYYFIKVALTGFPPFLIGGIRFVSAGVMVLAWCKMRGDKLMIGGGIGPAAISGILLLGMGNGAVVLSEQHLPSSLVAIFYTSQPLSFLLLDKPEWRTNMSNKLTVIGLGMGMLGVFLLFGKQLMPLFSDVRPDLPLAPMLTVMCGTLAFSVGSIFTKYYPARGGAQVKVGWQMFIAGIAFIIASAVTGEFTVVDWGGVPLQAWLAVAYLSVFGSIIAYTTFIWLITVRPMVQVSTYAYVNPIVAVLLGVMFGNEYITPLQLAGLGVILAGVFLVNSSKWQRI